MYSFFTSFLQQRRPDVRFREHASLLKALHCCGKPRIRTSGQLFRASGCCQRSPSQHAALSFISALVGTTSLLPLAYGQATTCGLLFIQKQVCSFACDLRDCSLRIYTNARFCLNGGGDCFHLWNVNHPPQVWFVTSTKFPYHCWVLHSYWPCCWRFLSEYGSSSRAE